MQKAAYVEVKGRRCSKSAGAAKLFPKRTRKPVVASLVEPSSPRKAGFLESFRAVFRGRRKGKTPDGDGGYNPSSGVGDSYESPPWRTRRSGDLRDRFQSVVP